MEIVLVWKTFSENALITSQTMSNFNLHVSIYHRVLLRKFWLPIQKLAPPINRCIVRRAIDHQRRQNVLLIKNYQTSQLLLTLDFKIISKKKNCVLELRWYSVAFMKSTDAQSNNVYTFPQEKKYYFNMNWKLEYLFDCSFREIRFVWNRSLHVINFSKWFTQLWN